ncbi:MAG: hypothetical protein KC519_05200, partial [Anaerolineae bacterium]|nr:hypothetical protein [Anaerolineae bacterium]
LDTVIPGHTGALFDTTTVENLMAAMVAFDAGSYDVRTLRAHAERFDTTVFNRQINAFVEQAWAAFQRKQSFTWNSTDSTSNASGL